MRDHPFIIPIGACCGFLISYSLIQCSKSHCIKEGKYVDAKKWFTSTLSSVLHTNSSHFLNPLILIFWPTWSYLNSVHHHSHPLSHQFHIILHHFISTQNHSKFTQNHLESIPINLKHVKDPKSIIIYPILGIIVAFSTLETYQSIKFYQSDLSTVIALSAR